MKRLTTSTRDKDVDSAAKVLTVLVELLRLVLTVPQGKPWQQEVELPNRIALGVGSTDLLLSFY